MDILVKAKEVSTELKLLNKKIEELPPKDDDPVTTKLKMACGEFLQENEKKAAVIENLFTRYKKCKQLANIGDLETKIKCLLVDAHKASEADVDRCLKYVECIQLCFGHTSPLDFSVRLTSIKLNAQIIKKELEKPLFNPLNIVARLQPIATKLKTFATDIKSGKLHYANVNEAVIASKVPEMLKNYRNDLWAIFCRMSVKEAEKKVVDAEDYFGFTCLLAFIVLIMKITGTNVYKVNGLAPAKKVNDSADPSTKSLSKDYKKLIGGGWFSAASYNELGAVTPPADASTVGSV